MKIAQIQRDIAEGLLNLTAATLPPALEGLRHLRVGDHYPQVSIRNRDGGTRVREDAAASYFDPDRCEVVIRFVPTKKADHGGGGTKGGQASKQPRRFTPIRIRGGSISDTVIQDRR